MVVRTMRRVLGEIAEQVQKGDLSLGDRKGPDVMGTSLDPLPQPQFPPRCMQLYGECQEEEFRILEILVREILAATQGIWILPGRGDLGRGQRPLELMKSW